MKRVYLLLRRYTLFFNCVYFFRDGNLMGKRQYADRRHTAEESPRGREKGWIIDTFSENFFCKYNFIYYFCSLFL